MRDSVKLAFGDSREGAGLNSTALRIEVLAVGVQTAICLLYLWHPELLLFWNALDADAVARIEVLVAPTTIAILALFYYLGACVDVFTAMLDGWLPYYRGSRAGDECIVTVWKSPSHARLRLENRETYNDIMRSNFDLRMLRSTAFNFFLIFFSQCAIITLYWHYAL